MKVNKLYKYYCTAGFYLKFVIFMNIIQSCTFVPPKINITGDKTAIERQIVGEYKELEKDSWIISSAKTTVQRTKGAGSIFGDRDLFLAMKIREFHKDKISMYKKKGLIGETNRGYVAYIKSPAIEKDKKKKEILMTIIENENNARKTIFVRTEFLKKNRVPNEKEILKIGRDFALEWRAEAQKNEWVQDDSGRWIKK